MHINSTGSSRMCVCVKVLSTNISVRVFASINHGPQAGPIPAATYKTPFPLAIWKSQRALHAKRQKRRVLGAFWDSSRRLRRLPRILSERAAGFRVVSGPQRGSNGDTGNVLRIIYPFHPAHPLWCPSIPLARHHNRLTNGRQIRTRNGTRAPCPPRAPPPPPDPFIREAASVGAFHETESRGGPRPSPSSQRATSHKITGQ